LSSLFKQETARTTNKHSALAIRFTKTHHEQHLQDSEAVKAHIAFRTCCEDRQFAGD